MARAGAHDLSLDDLLAVMREFVNPQVSRSGLDRCLRRHGVGSLKALQPQAAKQAGAGLPDVRVTIQETNLVPHLWAGETA